MSRAPFPIQPELTAIALAFRNRAMVAERVLPSVPVGTQEFKYFRHDLSQGITLPDTKVGRLSEPNRVEFSATEETDSARDYGLDDMVPIADIDNAPPGFDPIGNAVEYLTGLIELGREVRTAGVVMAAGNYAAANKETLVGADQWSDATSDPVYKLLTTFDGMAVRPNRLVWGRQVWSAIRQHPKVLAAVFPNGGNAAEGGVASIEAVRQLLELDDLIVGESFVNTAAKGQAANRTYVWGKSALAFYCPQRVSSAKELCLGFSGQWGSRVAGQQAEPHIGLRGSVRVRSGESRSETLCAPEAGFLFSNAIA